MRLLLEAFTNTLLAASAGMLGWVIVGASQWCPREYCGHMFCVIAALVGYHTWHVL